YRRILEKDLRLRVFLATRKIDRACVFAHKSLQQTQTHLLTDDRYNKVRDFLSIAEEKGILNRVGRLLVKDGRKLDAPWEFHRIRVDNPIAVMANALEPLKELQRMLFRTAWKPGFLIRREVVRLLKKAAMKEYKEDYKKFYVEEESKGIQVGAPILIKGKSRSMGVLLIHGYMAAPPEVGKLAEFLGRKGIWVYAPRLKGHGTSPEDLATRTYADWIRSVEDGYALMSALCDRVIVGGFSTGAGLALDLAVRIGDLPGVFAVSAPLRLQDAAAKFVPAVDVWNRLMSKIQLEGPKKEFLDNSPENPHINYHRNPVSGIRELERLMDYLEPELPKLTTPALVVQSRGDPVVNPKGSEKLFDLIGSEDKTYVLFNFDRHGILLGDGARRVYTVIWDFIRRLAEGGDRD
ncbi:MAG: alpha/beta fold hydrolase, partial [Desulfobacterales bacterium]|nr:alpha/beta fold hydrolase [Desulfobacterales bacterium]